MFRLFVAFSSTPVSKRSVSPSKRYTRSLHSTSVHVSADRATAACPSAMGASAEPFAFRRRGSPRSVQYRHPPGGRSRLRSSAGGGGDAKRKKNKAIRRIKDRKTKSELESPC